MSLTIAGRKAMCGGAALLVLAGCQGFEGGNMLKAESEASGSLGDAGARPVQRDVEAPKIFQETDQGLWDGRPSLGGIWVAYPDVKEPERVIIRNTANSEFVIGALFRRERANPGPAFQVSSEAAAALGMLAGAPARLNVTALRRDERSASEAQSAADALAAPDETDTSSLAPLTDAATETRATRPQARNATVPRPPAVRPLAEAHADTD